MNDPADVVGFTKDGNEYGYCASIGARDPAVTKCDFVRRDGTHHTLSSHDDKDNYSPKLNKALADWVREQGVATIDRDVEWAKQIARPLKGNWAYSDIVIWVNPVSADGVTTNAVLKLGGAVDGEAPVYPVVLSSKPFAEGAKYHTAIANDLSLSADGSELGAVGHFFCGEWCNAFEIYRAPVDAFASLVYNDSGFRHHRKGEYARAAELFSKATPADSSAKLPSYNLACAWARLKDERAKDALILALANDPDVKRRAKNDADFAGVRNEAWFIAIVGP